MGNLVLCDFYRYRNGLGLGGGSISKLMIRLPPWRAVSKSGEAGLVAPVVRESLCGRLVATAGRGVSLEGRDPVERVMGASRAPLNLFSI